MRKETVNHIIKGCREPKQNEYKSKHDWVGKVTHWKLCKRLNLVVLTNSICTNKSFLENETTEIEKDVFWWSKFSGERSIWFWEGRIKMINIPFKWNSLK